MGEIFVRFDSSVLPSQWKHKYLPIDSFSALQFSNAKTAQIYSQIFYIERSKLLSYLNPRNFWQGFKVGRPAQSNQTNNIGCLPATLRLSAHTFWFGTSTQWIVQFCGAKSILFQNVQQFHFNSSGVGNILEKRLILQSGVTNIITAWQLEGKTIIWRCPWHLNLGLAVCDRESRLREMTLVTRPDTWHKMRLAGIWEKAWWTDGRTNGHTLY